MNQLQRYQHKKRREQAQKAPRHVIKTKNDGVALVPIMQPPPKGEVAIEISEDVFDLIKDTPYEQWPTFTQLSLHEF